MNSNYYVLFGMKDNTYFFVCNTNPILWTPLIQQAKFYDDRYNAEYAVLRDWYNFRQISDSIDNGVLDSFWIGIMNSGYMLEKIKLLGE